MISEDNDGRQMSVPGTGGRPLTFQAGKGTDMSIIDFDSASESSTPLTRVEETVHAVRADIVSGELEPGSKLAVDRLRTRYGVGSSTIREALSLLLPDGLVTARGQRGFAVSEISIDDLQDLSNTRILLETDALRTSIARGDDDWEVRNHQFHDATTAACGSRWILHMLNILHHHTERYRRLALTDRSIPRDVHAEHLALMEATLARDADTACEVAAMHIQRTTDVLAARYGAKVAG